MVALRRGSVSRPASSKSGCSFPTSSSRAACSIGCCITAWTRKVRVRETVPEPAKMRLVDSMHMSMSSKGCLFLMASARTVDT